MQVHRGIQHLPLFKNAVVTIGTFDGVHAGHSKIIRTLLDVSKKINGESVIITFDPHPRKIINPALTLQLINTLEEKIELISKTGIDHIVIVPFNQEFSEQPAHVYIKNFLIKNFHPHTIIIGYDHHFGKERKGNFQLLKEKADEYGYRLLEISKQTLNEIDVSSTKIRNALLSSDVVTANNLLGYTFFFEGLVIKGDQLGRRLGYPTANLAYTDKDKIRLGHGVFAVKVTVDDITFNGMMSIGTRPTLTNSDERVEVNIFDFDEEIYGKTIRVKVHFFLRPQEKYNSLDELKTQLEKDKTDSISRLTSPQ